MTYPKDYRKMVASRLKDLSNKELLEMVYEYSIPDDYDGVFTYTGDWCREESRIALEERLVACEFIDGVVTEREGAL